MNNQFIMLSGRNFKVIDILEKISIADSFVVPSNKTGGGNGEAKLYLGQNTNELISFFGNRGFEINCVLSKHNLISYLNNAYSEYNEPSQNYRDTNDLSDLWEKRYDKIKDLESHFNFRVKDQNQIEGPRVYINAFDEKRDKLIYGILREVPLPIISYINIYKLTDDSLHPFYYFTLHLNGAETSVDEVELANADIDKYIPGSEDTEDIEKEVLNENVNIESPFDPNKIKVRTTSSNIGQIIEDLNDDIINLDTEFQRKSGLWKVVDKSRFIESILLKLPIPAFYFNEKEENELEVIDGLQRISTIKSFVIDQEFELIGLEFLKDYNGKKFSELPSTFQRRIKTFQITTYTIEKGTPNDVKFIIFYRVNTGGLKLTEQEIRHAINQGRPAELVADLARGADDIYNDTKNIRVRKNQSGEIIKLYSTKEGREFIKATDNRIGTFRMEDRDFVTRFVAFYLINYKKYEPNLDTFLNNGMAAIKDLDDYSMSKLKDDFYESMKLAYHIFGNDAFRKRFSKSDGRKPINKALFEVLSVSFAKMTESDRLLLKNNKSKFKRKFIQLHHDGAFLRAISQGTAIKESVMKRFNEIESIIRETIEND